MNSTLFGQFKDEVYISDHQDTLFFSKNELLFKLKKKSFGYYYGYGTYKIRGSRLIINTIDYPFKKSHYSYSINESDNASVKFLFKDFSGKPIPNIEVHMVSNEDFVNGILTSDSSGEAIINDLPSEKIDYYITNNLYYNNIKIPFIKGEYVIYHVTLEYMDIMYFENEKVVFKYELNNDEITLQILTPKGLYKTIELNPYIKFHRLEMKSAFYGQDLFLNALAERFYDYILPPNTSGQLTIFLRFNR